MAASTTLDLHESQAFPHRITYPTDFFPCSNAGQQAMIEQFVAVLEESLETKRTTLSIIQEWERSPPKAAEGKTLKCYLDKVSRSAA